MKNYQNLHVKICLSDNAKAIVTSVNLTNNGIYLENEFKVVETIQSDINEMMTSELCGEFKKENIHYIKKLIKNSKKDFRLILDKDDMTILVVNEITQITLNLSGWQLDILKNQPNDFQFK